MVRLVLSISAVVCIWVSSPTLAQVSNSPPGGATTASDTGQLVEITVTAQRRSEREQDVPISMTTITQAAAEQQGVSGTESLGLAVPALQFSRQTGNGGTPFIRGVGTSEGTAGSESPVAVYVDDVYVGSPSATLFQFNNIDSVEVLKGPQGTLFGRNATGGVVSVHTRQPSQTDELDTTFGYSSFDTYYGSLYASGGLSDTVAMNVAIAGSDQTQGYGRNLVNGSQTLLGWNYGVRAQLSWTPDDATKLLVIGEYSDRKDDAGMSVVILPGTVAIPGGTYRNPYGTYDTPSDFSHSITWSTSAKLTHDFGPVDLVSISAYRNTKLDWLLDVDGSPTGFNLLGVSYQEYDNALSQEFQVLSHQEGPFRWIAGTFFYRAQSEYNPQTLYGAVEAGNGGYRNLYTHEPLTSYAGFGEVTYEFAKDSHIIAGLRYTSDKLSYRPETITATGVTTIATPGEGTTTFSKPTWRLTLDHAFTPDVLAYGTYSRGFKSGRYNTLAGTAADNSLLPPVAPEVLDAYELGVKTEMLDHKLRLNGSVFYYDYKNLQVSIVEIGYSIVENAATAKIKGADFDWNFVPDKYFQLSGGLELLDAKYSSFPNGPYQLANPAVCTPTPATTAAPTGGFATCSENLSGNYLSRSPKYTASLSGTATLPTSIGVLALNTSVYRNGGFYWEPDNNYHQNGYTLLSTTASWTDPSQKFTVKAYGRNLLHEYYFDYYSTGGLRAAGTPALPRTFGVEVDTHF